MRVVDVFCGMGGLSLGFKRAGFEVSGYDKAGHALTAYAQNVGPAHEIDLGDALPSEPADLVVGGPPCRPWSPMNLHRRNALHDDYDLVRTFDRYVMQALPKAFVLENVPFLQYDFTFVQLVEALTPDYDVEPGVYAYSNWGAGSKRRRLFVVGIKRSTGHNAREVLTALDRRRASALTVRQSIERFSRSEQHPEADHEWPLLRTIEKYRPKYESGQFGWYRLEWSEPAPSFGNVTKTYTLHPDSWRGIAPRVVSPREVMAILGFPDSYVFPPGVPRSAKYRMVADAVSPAFSTALSLALVEVLGNEK